MNLRRIFFLSVLMLLISSNISAQRKNNAYLNYIDKYKNIAIGQMNQYGIPASITLAQGLLESAAGNSELALKSNNHFGIKCGGTWTGKTTTHFDDGRNECFRVYKNVEESYRDHSIFLQKARYQKLFKLSRTDYKGWARGLKECGYATSPTYADRLINLIELYQLYQYDNGQLISDVPETATRPVIIDNRVTVYPNGIPYIIIKPGETLETVCAKYGFSRNKLLKFNELPKNASVNIGDIIYFAKKKSKASKEFKKNCWHKVRYGESMYSISQAYGIRLKNLYRMNFKDPATYVPREGELIKIR